MEGAAAETKDVEIEMTLAESATPTSEKVPEPVEVAPARELWSFADRTDMVLITVGSLAAVAGGVLYVHMKSPRTEAPPPARAPERSPSDRVPVPATSLLLHPRSLRLSQYAHVLPHLRRAR